MQRRKFVVGLGSLAAGGAAATGTGALSQIRAERNVTGQIVEDSVAYLTVNGSGGATNGFIVEYDSDGEVRLNFGDNGSSAKGGSAGAGLNPDALNRFHDAFRLLNTGPENLEVWFTTQSSRINFYRNDNPSTSMQGSGNAQNLNSGDAMNIGVEVDTTGLGKGDEATLFDADDDFSINADPQ